jgi:hypothetical protein
MHGKSLSSCLILFRNVHSAIYPLRFFSSNGALDGSWRQLLKNLHVPKLVPYLVRLDSFSPKQYATTDHGEPVCRYAAGISICFSHEEVGTAITFYASGVLNPEYPL